MKNLISKYTRVLGISAAVACLLAGMSHATDKGPVKIGFLVGFTGDYAAWSAPEHDAALLAVEEINASGGVLGRKVELVSEDNGSTVAGAVRGAQKLASVDGVSAIVGPESDPVMALLKFAKDNKVPVIPTAAGTDGLDKAGGTGKFVYRTTASDSFLGVVHAKMILDELKAHELVLVVENLEGTQSAATNFKRAFEKLGGKVTKTITLSSGQANYLSEIQDLAGQEPELIYLAAGQTAGVSFVKQAYQRGYDWKWWVTAELQTPDFVNATGVDVVKGFMNAVTSQAEGSKSAQRFVDAYEKRFGEKPEPGFYQAETYDAVIAVALAMEAAGATTGAAVDEQLAAVSGPGGEKIMSFAEGVSALKAGKDIDYDGASGSIDFDQNGNVTAPAARLLRVDDQGAWTTVKVVDSGSFPAN